MSHIRNAVVLTALLVSSGCHLVNIVPPPKGRPLPGPVSTDWTSITREDLGVTFELPDNYQLAECCALGSMVTIHAEPVDSQIYGLHIMRYRDDQPALALEVTVHTITPWIMGADRGEIADVLASPEDPDTSLWLYRRVFAPRMAGLKADKWRTVNVSGHTGVAFEAWEQVGPERRNFSRVTVVALSEQEALVIQGRFHPKSKDEDRETYWKIVESVTAKPPRVLI